MPRIVALVRDAPYRFILVCDDLSFAADDASYKELKSVLEGSVFRSSDNVLIYATSNRRHLLPEHMADNLAATHEGGELHESEAVEEKISLSDRFGLWLSFQPFKQDAYLEVVEHWLDADRRAAWVDHRADGFGPPRIVAVGARARRAQRPHARNILRGIGSDACCSNPPPAMASACVNSA